MARTTLKTKKAAPRKATPKRRKRRLQIPEWKSLPGWLYTIVCICLVGGVVLWLQATGGKTGVSDSIADFSARNGLLVNNIFIEGRYRTPAQDVLKALHIKVGDPIAAFDPAAAKNNIMQLPWVSSVVVRRTWPDQIFVHLNERVPIAVWQHRQKLYVIDKQGISIEEVRKDSYPDFITVIGENAPPNALNLLAMLSLYNDLKTEVSSAIWQGNRRWDLHLKSGLLIMLPAELPDKALDILMQANHDHQLFTRPLVRIDLRLNDRMIMKAKDGTDPALLPKPATPVPTVTHGTH